MNGLKQFSMRTEVLWGQDKSARRAFQKSVAGPAMIRIFQPFLEGGVVEYKHDAFQNATLRNPSQPYCKVRLRAPQLTRAQAPFLRQCVSFFLPFCDEIFSLQGVFANPATMELRMLFLERRKRGAMGRLENKMALITGGSSGLGRAAALLFLTDWRPGVSVDRDKSALNDSKRRKFR